MANEQLLSAQRREQLGTANCRRLRKSGLVPGNVYGHGQDSISITVSVDTLNPIIAAGNRVVDLELDGQTEKAMFRDVQWDTWGSRIQHFDLIRVSADERIEIEVPVEVRGTAAGVTAGGSLDLQLRSISIDCLAIEAPDSIAVRVGKLEIGDVIHVSDLEIPEGANVLSPPEAIVVQVIKVVEVEETEEDADVGPVEPEVIGQKKDDDGDEE